MVESTTIQSPKNGMGNKKLHSYNHGTTNALAFCPTIPEDLRMDTQWLIRTLAIFATAVCLTSCPETTIPTNFGDGPARLEAKEWNGEWREVGSSDKDDIISFTVNSEIEGTLIVQGKGKDDKPLTIFLRSTGGKDSHLCFLTYTEKTGASEGPLRLATLAKDGVLFLWNANHDEIKKALKAGELRGNLVKGEKEDDTHSQLTKDPFNQAKLLEPKFWEWTKPEVFSRLHR